MPQPKAYEREADFTERDGDDTDNNAINRELDAAGLSVNQLRQNLALLQRDDGSLIDGIVTPESLSPEVVNALAINVDSRVFLAQQAAGSAITSAQTALAAQNAAEDFADEAGLSQIASALNAEGALASRAAVDNRIYPGGYAANPTTRPDGSAMLLGDEYFNSATNMKMVYRAAGWVNYEEGAAAQVALAAAQKELAMAQAAIATAGGNTATSQVALAVAAKTAAETAANAAQLSAGIYSTTGEGIAATTSSKYFSVPSPDSNEYLILYLNSAGVAVEQKRYPSAALVASATPLGAAWSVQDGAGSAAIEVLDDGTFRVAKLSADVQVIGNASVDDAATPGYVFTVCDAAGNIAGGWRNDGTLEAVLASVPGASVPLVERYGGTYSAQLNFIATQGQSLAGGSDGAVTTAQEYDNIGFQAMTTSPAATYPLTVANTQTTQTGESPMYGTAGFIKELIAKEQGLEFATNDYQLLSCCNGTSGAPIDEINKGGVRGMYEKAISQAASGKSIAASAGKTFNWQANTWTQGESDEAMAKDTYKAKLKQLALDFNVDGKAITEQKNDIQFITYQLSRFSGKDTVAVALLEASEEVAYIHCASPMYFMESYDGTHLKAASSKWLGGYYGLAYKRIVIDRKEWSPLKPVQHAVIGNTLDLYFSKEGLVFDTIGMPAQVNQGFTVFDGAGAAVTISSVVIIKPNRVRFTFATPPQAGWTVKYGHINVVGKPNWTGCGGNLRDSQGDTIFYAAINKPMHNWCVIFSRTI